MLPRIMLATSVLKVHSLVAYFFICAILGCYIITMGLMRLRKRSHSCRICFCCQSWMLRLKAPISFLGLLIRT